MRVLLNPVGSHGDVHPLVGIGAALKARGHRITLITSAAFRDLADRHRFDFAPVGTEEDYHALTHDPNLWHPSKSLQVLFGGERAERMLRQGYGHLAAQYEPGDTVLLSGSLGLAGRLAHEALGVPFITVHLQPMSQPSVEALPAYPTMTPRAWWPRWWRRTFLWIGERVIMDRLLAGPVNRLRADLGLPTITRIFGSWRMSPQLILGLFPEWYGSAPDWPSHFRHAGFVRYDQGEALELDAPLKTFLDAGPAPVVVSFGSAMRVGRPYFEAAVTAIQRLGLRGLILAKSGDQIPTDLPPTMAHADYAPFSLVFPRASTIVHHGGIGTSAQAMTAGVPQLVMPLAFDQHDNAARLGRLGVARAIDPKRFTPDRVAEALSELTTSAEILTACRDVATRVPRADNLDAICSLVEGLKGSDRRGQGTKLGTNATDS